MTVPFEAAVVALSKRVQQVARYHLVRGADPLDEIAHFTNWDACNAMFEAARGGIALWASDADCLNDSLEGKELLRFAELTVDRTAKGEELNWVTGRWSREAWERPSAAEAGHEDLPHLIRERWLQLPELFRKLYEPPPASVVMSGPRAEAMIGAGVYLVSFCRNVDRLDLWRAYTTEASGVCLVMPLAAAVASASPSWKFYRVAYDDRSKARAWALLFQPLHNAIEEAEKVRARLPSVRLSRIAARLDRIRKVLAPALYLFKNEQFRAEQEIRLVYAGARAPKVGVKVGGGGTYVATNSFFLAGPGCRAILGPKTPTPHHRASVLRTRHAAMTHGAAFTVGRSGVSYI